MLFQRFNWADQNHIYGAYTGFFIPGVQHIPEMWRCVADNFGEKLPNMPNLWFAGADYWTGIGNGYMEGEYLIYDSYCDIYLVTYMKK